MQWIYKLRGKIRRDLFQSIALHILHCISNINPLKPDTQLNSIKKLSSYLTENTMHLYYTDKSLKAI
jgi:hypothetical protein